MSIDDDYGDGDGYGVEMKAALCGGGKEWHISL